MGKTTLFTIVIPAYNEERRLPKTLPRVQAFLDQAAVPLDVIVVNNASTDATQAIAEGFAATDRRFQVLYQPVRGKGAAVRLGMLAAQGQYAFICDADLAMPIEELPRFYPQNLGGPYDIAIASREAPGAVRYNEPAYRHWMGRGFNFIVRTLLLPGFQDTQCGFKAFRREVARDLFAIQRIDGWAFDVEVLAAALRRGYRVLEVPIPWYYGPESRVHPLRDTFTMLREVLAIRRAVRAGVYDRPASPAPPSTRPE